MKKYTFIYIIFVFSLYACRNNSVKTSVKAEDSTSNIFQKEPDAKCINVEIDKNSVLKFSDVYDSVKFIKLETTEDCLIGEISKIIPLNNKLVIQDGRTNIFTFDYNGKFLNKIGSKGQANIEYNNIDDIAYDRYKNELCVYDHDGKKIIRYKLDGTFVDVIKLDWWMSAIQIIDNDKYLIYNADVTQKNGEHLDYYFYVLNSKGEVLYGLLPNNKSIQFNHIASHVLNSYGEKTIFSTYYTGNIYEIYGDSIIPKYYMDYGSHNIPYTYFNNITSSEFDKLTENKDFAENLMCLETDDYLINKIGYGRFYNCFYSKKTGEMKEGERFIDDMKYLINDGVILCNKGDTIISYYDALQFKYHQDRIKEANGKSFKNYMSAFLDNIRMSDGLRQNMKKAIESSNVKLSLEDIDFINSIQEDDNPILCISVLKKVQKP